MTIIFVVVRYLHVASSMHSDFLFGLTCRSTRKNHKFLRIRSNVTYIIYVKRTIVRQENKIK